jgi:hypothetical protein
MTPLRRPPRQVYRVYSEAEFLAAADWSGEAVTEEWTLDGAAEQPESSTWGRVAGVAVRGANQGAWRRAAGLAALTGAVAAVAGVVVLSASRSTGRRGTLGLSADSRSPRSAASPAPAALPASSQPLGRDRRPGAPRGPAAPRRTAQRRDVREVARTGPAVAASPTAATLPAPTPPAAPGPTPTPPATTSPATPPPATVSANAARAEFGFERQAG